MTGFGRHWPRVFTATSFDVLSLVVGTLLQIFLMRTLGVEAYGLYAYGCALGFLAMALADFGSGYAGVRQVVTVGGSHAALASLFVSVQGIKLAAATVVVAVALLVHVAVPAWVPDMAPIALGALGSWLLPGWFISGRNRVVEVARALLVGRIACALGIALLVSGPEQRGLAMALTLSPALVASLLLYADREVLGLVRGLPQPRAGALLEAGASGAKALPVAIFPTFATAALQAVILSAGSPAILGLFSAADRIRSAIQGLYIALAGHAFPSSVGNVLENSAGTKAALNRILLLTLLVPALMAVVMYVSADWIVRLTIGEQYLGASATLRILCLAFVPSAVTLLFITHVLLPFSREWKCLLASCSGLAVQCLLAWWLVSGQGAIGAAYAFVAGELVALAVVAFLLRPYWRKLN